MEYLTPEDYATAEANGICRKTAQTRFYWRGWSKERTITEPIHDHNFTKKYRDKCAEIGLSYSTFKERIRRGLTPEEAFMFKRKRAKLTREDLEIAKSNGIGPHTAKVRAYNYRWSVQRAITEPIHAEYRRKDSVI